MLHFDPVCAIATVELRRHSLTISLCALTDFYPGRSRNVLVPPRTASRLPRPKYLA